MEQQHSRLQVGLILGSSENQIRDAEAARVAEGLPLRDRPELTPQGRGESGGQFRGHGSGDNEKDRSWPWAMMEVEKFKEL